MSTAPVLVVQHQDQCPPGWVGDWLRAAGCGLDVRRPYAGESLPAGLSGHAGMVVLGGSMGAYDDEQYPWLTDVKALVREADRDGVPVLGICLGHQLAAVALGGTVQRNPRGQQIGVLPVGWLPAAREDPLLHLVSDAQRVVQWNNDVVSVLPDGAGVLARAPEGEVQAARLAPTVWGLQCHPEAGAEIVAAWAAKDRDAVAERGLDVDRYVADVAGAQQQLEACWRPLGEAFASVVRRVPV